MLNSPTLPHRLSFTITSTCEKSTSEHDPSEVEEVVLPEIPGPDCQNSGLTCTSRATVTLDHHQLILNIDHSLTAPDGANADDTELNCVSGPGSYH